LSFLKIQPANERAADVPDVELVFVPGGYHSDEGAGIKRGMRLSDSIYNTVYKELEDVNIDTFSIMPMLFHPKSVGYLQLKSSNPWHWPKLYPNFFQYADDVETLLQTIKYVLKLAKTPPFQKLGTRLHSVPLPNCQHLHFSSDEYWRCSIRTLSCTLHHQVGTCKMGPASDRSAIVSPELKVHGIKRLRVADVSVLPEAPTSHTNAVSFMIGEKAADMIKKDWK